MTGVALGAAAGCSVLGPAGPMAAAAAGPAPVDFSLRFGNTEVKWVGPRRLVSLTLTVTNVATTDAGSDVKIVVATPFYINFREDALPPGTAYIVNNPSPAVPEMVTFTVPAERLTAGSSHDFTLGVEQVPDGPQLYDQFDATGLAVTGTGLTGNHTSGTIGLPINPPRIPPPGTNAINVFYTYTQPVVKVGRTSPLTIRFGNASRSSARADGTFTFVTPYSVKIDRHNLAFRLLHPTYHHDETDPRVPDIVSIPVPRAFLVAGPSTPIDLLKTLTIPLVTHSENFANRAGRGHLAVGEGDFDSLLAVATGRISVVQP